MTLSEITDLEKQISKTLGTYPELFTPYKDQTVGKVKLEKVELDIDKERIILHLTRQITFIALREELIVEWEDTIKETLTKELDTDFLECRVGLYYNNIPLERFIPNFYRKNIAKDSRRYATPYSGVPLLSDSTMNSYHHGLSSRHIALWASHGYLYESRDDEPQWKFQRPALFRTIEDLNSFDFVYSYLAPMLENSGAVLVMPRERSVQPKEVIVDNDHTPRGSRLVLHSGEWKSRKGGFKDIDTLRNENPFEEGTYMISSGSSSAEFVAAIPQRGRYGVTVSYKTLLDSPNDVTVEVKHRGGISTLKLNQQMMGSTWLYIGEWEFEGEGSVRFYNNEGTLSIDAVRFGGGMGRVQRGGTVSGVAQWVEAARYYMQFCGVPKEIYRTGEIEKFGKDSDEDYDYVDDYKSRGDWVNWVLDSKNVPLDLSFTPHTNAGVVDSIFGTLSIHYTELGEGTLRDGSPKFVSRELAEMVQTQIIDDIRALHCDEWTRRSTYDMQYAETSRPTVPSMILEIMSHQNKADMDYFCLPQFRFSVARATYKGMLKFLAYRYNIPYVVQPLPPHSPDMILKNDSTVLLSWLTNLDELEPTARPKAFKVYTREGVDGAFDSGIIVRENSIAIPIERDGVMRSYRVTAINSGGESFPSEVLSCGFSVGDTLQVQRVKNNCNIFGETVPYIHDWGYTGEVYDWDESSVWVDNEVQPGYGASSKRFVGVGRKGETLDNTTQNGNIILENGGSYISSGSNLNHWRLEKREPKKLQK